MIDTGSAVAILAIELVSGIDFDPTWTFLPVIVWTVLFLAGVALFMTSLSPSFQVGNLLANHVGIVLAMVSLDFYTIDQAPLHLRLLGYVSPLKVCS